MIPQTSKPEGYDKYYRTKSVGGYSPCIPGNNDRGQRDLKLNVLPNCVGWATGRFNEIGKWNECRYLGNTNAKYFIRMARAQGLKVTAEPTLGGCMVWSNKDAGHVAIVEQIVDDKTVITSESEWYGAVFMNYTRVKGDGNWRKYCKWMGSGYTYLGCIKNPAVEDDMVTDRNLYNKQTKQTVTVKGILKDGQNYIRLADLAEMGVLDVSYNAEKNLAEVGCKCPLRSE